MYGIPLLKGSQMVLLAVMPMNRLKGRMSDAHE